MKLIAKLVALFMLSGVHVYSQNEIRGHVYDNTTKEPLPGVSVFAPGNKCGTVTDASGSFLLKPDQAIDSVSFRYIGYNNVTVPVTGSELIIGLKPIAQSLQPVLITASRDHQSRNEIPATINSVSSQVIQEAHPTQLNQLLNKVPGLVMKDLNNEQHMMSVRQPMTSRPYFLYLEDGLPIAPVGNFNHNQLIEVNMLGIRTIEVAKGPASAIYGSNAVGGAINFITQSPSLVPVTKVGFQQNNYGYQRLEFYAGNHLTPKFGISVGGYMAKQRNGWQAYSDFDKLSMSAKAVYYASSRTDLTAYFTTNYLNTETGGSVDSVAYYSKKYLATNNFCFRTVNGMRARFTLNHYWSEQSKTTATVYFGKNSIAQNPRYRIKNINLYSAKGEENEDSYVNFGALVQHVQSFDFLNSKLIAGLTSNYAPTNYVSQFGTIVRDSTTGNYSSFTLADSLLADYHTLLIGAGSYVQYELSPLEKMKVVLGMRYDVLQYGYNNELSAQAYSAVPDTTIRNMAFSPRVGVTYDLGNDRGVYANYSKGFSPPQASDLFFGTKVPVLKPSQFNNYEAGAWAALFNNRLYVDVCVYRLEGSNEIISFRLPDNSTEYRNSGRTLHQGVEYSVTYRPLEDLLMRVGGTNAIHKYIRYEVQQTTSGEIISYDGNFMPEAPSFIANAELTYKPHWFPGFRCAIEWQRIGPWYKNDANTFRYEDRTFLMKGVSLLHLRAGYVYRNVEVYCNIHNVTNELYANGVTRGSSNKDTYVAGAPRVIAFGFVYSFAGSHE